MDKAKRWKKVEKKKFNCLFDCCFLSFCAFLFGLFFLSPALGSSFDFVFFVEHSLFASSTSIHWQLLFSFICQMCVWHFRRFLSWFWLLIQFSVCVYLCVQLAIYSSSKTKRFVKNFRFRFLFFRSIIFSLFLSVFGKWRTLLVMFVSLLVQTELGECVWRIDVWFLDKVNVTKCVRARRPCRRHYLPYITQFANICNNLFFFSVRVCFFLFFSIDHRFHLSRCSFICVIWWIGVCIFFRHEWNKMIRSAAKRRRETRKWKKWNDKK